MSLVNFKHQTELVNRFKDRTYGALFVEAGLGKTRVMIEILEHKYKEQNITAAMIVTTKGLMGNWAFVELPKHATLEYDTQIWSDVKFKPSNKLVYFIINIDAIVTQRFMPIMKEFLRVHPKFAFVVDESTVVKTGKAKRTKMAIRIAARASYRFIMSGTPITNSPLDLYSQCEILQPDLLGYKSIYAFKADYAVTTVLRFGSRSFEKISGWKNLDRLTNTIQKFGSILKKEDCLDLPPKIFRSFNVPLVSAQQIAYDDLCNKAVTYLQNNEITALNAISLINRLLQICAGQMKLPDGSYLAIENDRLATLRELVDECSGKTIVWNAYVNTGLKIKELFGKEAIHLEAGLTVNNRHDTLNRFKDSDVKVLIANPASAGHGITLTESANVIYYSRTWNLEHYWQSQDRTHRIGQTSSVLYTNLIALGTIEEKVLAILDAKKALADKVINAPLDFVKEALGLKTRGLE
jgi:SNF2 family DNA or RNA helicase